jgi:peptidoglycan hydrolase-like protein with peptidoglycan-binding domain
MKQENPISLENWKRIQLYARRGNNMQMLKQSSIMVLRMMIERPGSTAGLVVFGLGFALIAGNALYSQQGSHPDPIWSTAKQQDNLSQNYDEEIARVSQPNTITRSVLTQRISVKNIPVPTANPARSTSIAAQSSLVRDVQSALADIGFYKGKIDGIYGTGTKTAIMDFQQRAGIIPNGEASYGLLSNLKSVQAVTDVSNTQPPATQSQSVSSLPKVLVFDAETVTRIQAGLKENFGDESISVDGVMGNQTKNAIKRFQKRFKLEANGELDNQTLQKMLSVGILNSI